MSDNIEEVHEYSILGQGLATLKVQAGFVEGVVAANEVHKNIEKLFESIFINNKEYCVILWNGIPFRLSYIEDLPFVVRPFSKMLKILLDQTEEEWQIDFKSKNFEASWFFSLDENQMLAINGDFRKVPGGHEKAINAMAIVRITREDLLREWKLLLEQLIKGLEDSGSMVRTKADNIILNDLENANRKITERALRYQYEKR